MTIVNAVRADGCGNAYLFVDAASVGARVAARIREVAERRTPAWLAQVDAAPLDGIILLVDDPDAVWRLEVWNADGSRGAVCGNGLRAAGLIAQVRRGLDEGVLRSDSGLHRFSVQDRAGDGAQRVRVLLGAPSFAPESIPFEPGLAHACDNGAPLRVALAVGERVTEGFALSVGNPHFVVPCDVPVRGILGDVAELERHPAFPTRVNVSFVWSLGPGRVGMRTHERGSGETASCGSGACAAAVVAHTLGWSRRTTVVRQNGGELEVEVLGDALALTGPARIGASVSFDLGD